MTTRKIPGRGGSGSAHRISGGPARLRILLALPAAAAAVGTVKTATIVGVTACRRYEARQQVLDGGTPPLVADVEKT
jgi:hypothetical protein